MFNFYRFSLSIPLVALIISVPLYALDLSQPLTQVSYADLPTPFQIPSSYKKFYVAPNGKDRNNGHSKLKPFKSLSRAIALAPRSSIIYLRAGLYRTGLSTISKSNFVISNYKSEKARLAPRNPKSSDWNDAFDRINISRPQGSSVDIGAYEQ